MTEVSRQSTFPPILKSYNPAITASFNPSGSPSPAKSSRKADQQAQEARPQAVPAQSKEQRSGKKKGDRGTINQKTGSSSGLLTADKIRREHELELRRKRNQKAEATLMCWDALLENQRLKKCQTLQQRVGIQRDLISKNDELSSELRRREEEERLEKIQARKSAQKKLAEALRSHIERIQEHKKRIAEKLNALKLAKEEQDNNNVNISTEELLSPVHARLAHSRADDEYEEQYNPQGQQDDNAAAVYQIFGGEDTKLDTKAMLESLWGGKKMAAHKQIRPIIRRSDKLKQVASPSVKQCLEVYEQPTAHDRYTGKPIPLGEVLHEIITKAEMGTNYLNWNNAMELMNKQLQRRAQALLRRRDPYNSLNMTLAGNEGWFTELLEEDEKAQDRAASILEKRRIKEKAALLLPKRTKNGGTSLKIKRKLPTFLTPDGDLLTGSLEEFGDQLYCSPSKTTEQPTSITKHEWQHETTANGSSVFLTDLHSESVDSINLEQKSTTKLVRELSEKSMSPRRTSKVMKGWQPLSYSALSEHNSVSELPVKGLGHMAHGRYSMWRPEQSCALRASE